MKTSNDHGNSKLLIYTGIFISLLLSGCTSQKGKEASVYYVDSVSGNDQSDGHSKKNAWKSLDRVNREAFLPGDKIMIKCGSEFFGQLRPQGSGSAGNPIVIDCYGITGDPVEIPDLPVIHARGEYQSALYLHNVQHWEVNHLELTNTGEKRVAGRAGAHIHLNNFGEARDILLKNLVIHDVNGSLVKKEGGGQGILIQNEGDSIPSRFNGLTIEGCTISRTERNAVIFESAYWKRDRWYPSLNVVIRKNLIEEVPGDGIVPIGCLSALIEHNVMRDCTRLLPDGEAAAGIWPWSCDSTIIQYNEVSGHKAPWDAQGFDSDWNCRHTVIQYNFSHDNEGGFLLICSPSHVKMPENIGNDGTIIRYNLSVNDGLRDTGTHAGFSPVFHISGPVTNNLIYNNTIAMYGKPAGIDRKIIKMDNWGGDWPANSLFANNIFFVTDSASYDFGKAADTRFENNLFYGNQTNLPDDGKALFNDPEFEGGTAVSGISSPEFSATRVTDVSRIHGFRLNAGSPGIGAGTAIPANGGSDILSSPLPVGSCTIGAFEWVAPSGKSKKGISK